MTSSAAFLVAVSQEKPVWHNENHLSSSILHPFCLFSLSNRPSAFEIALDVETKANVSSPSTDDSVRGSSTNP